MTTVTQNPPGSVHRAMIQAYDRRATAILALADSCADANHYATSGPIKLWACDKALIAGLLPNLAPEVAEGHLIEVVEFVFRSRGTDEAGRELSDAEIAEHLDNGRDVARDAILADTRAAGAA